MVEKTNQSVITSCLSSPSNRSLGRSLSSGRWVTNFPKRQHALTALCFYPFADLVGLAWVTGCYGHAQSFIAFSSRYLWAKWTVTRYSRPSGIVARVPPLIKKLPTHVLGNNNSVKAPLDYRERLVETTLQRPQHVVLQRICAVNITPYCCDTLWCWGVIKRETCCWDMGPITRITWGRGRMTWR